MKLKHILVISILSLGSVEALPNDSASKIDIQIGLHTFFNGFNGNGFVEYSLPAANVFFRISRITKNKIVYGAEFNMVRTPYFFSDYINPWRKKPNKNWSRLSYQQKNSPNAKFTNTNYLGHNPHDYNKDLQFVDYPENYYIGVFVGKKFNYDNWDIRTNIHLSVMFNSSSSIRSDNGVYSNIVEGLYYSGSGGGISYMVKRKMYKSFHIGFTSAFYAYYLIDMSPSRIEYFGPKPNFHLLNTISIDFVF